MNSNSKFPAILSCKDSFGNCFSGDSVVKYSDKLAYMSFKENRFVYKSTPDNPSANIAQLFEDTQLSPLDGLYDENQKGINLADAEKRGLITAELRARLEAIPDAEELFKSILAVESEEANTEAKKRSAFKTAFRKFINKEAFEAETGLDANDPVNKVLLAKLKEVLRSDLSIGDSGFKGRSELQSAARRLRMLLADEKAEAELSTSKSTLPAKGRKSSSLLAKVKEQTAKEIPIVQAELNAEKVKTTKVKDLEAKLAVEKAKAPVIQAEVANLEAKLVVEKAKAPVIQAEVANLEAWLANEKAKVPVVQAEVDQLEAWLTVEKTKATVVQAEVADLEAKLVVEKAKAPAVQARVEELEAKLKDLREKDSDYVAWIVNKAFRSKKSPSEIKTLERKHTDAKDKEDKLKGVYQYFSKGDEVEKIVKANTDLEGLILDGDNAWKKVHVKLKKPEDLPLNQRITALQQAMDSKKKSRDNIRDPSGDALKKMSEPDLNKLLNNNADRRDALSNEIGEFESALEPLNEAKEKFKIAKEMVAKLLESLAAAEKAANLKVQFIHGGTTYKVQEMAKEMKEVKSDPTKLLVLYKNFGGFFEPPGTQVDAFLSGFDAKFAEIEKEVNGSKKAWEDAKSDRGQNEDHVDHSFTMRIHEAILAEQIAMGIIPDVPLEKQSGAAAINLASDIAMIQATEDCEALAKKASPRLLDAVHEANFKQHVVFMRFKNGEKEVEPFKDLKLDDFKNLAKLESLFKTGKLRCNLDKAGGGEATNEVNAFFLLAAFQIMDQGSDKPSTQAVLLERKIKEKLAQRPGLVTRMNVAGASRIRDDMFNDQLALIKPQVEEFFGDLDGEPNRGDRNDAKIKELELRHEIIVEENRIAKEKHRFEDELLEKDDQELMRKRNDLIDEGDKWGIKDRLSFAQQSALMNFVQNSAISHAVGDFGHNVWDLVKGKTEKAAIGAVGMGVRLPLEAANVVAWKTARAGAVVGRSLWEAALTPVRLARDLGMAGLRVVVPGAQPLSQLKSDVVRDVGAVFSGVKDTSASMKEVTTVKKANSKSRVASTWNKSKEAVAGVHWQSKTHKDHTKVDIADLKAKADEFAKKAALPAIEGFEAVEPAKYDKRIEQLDGFLKPAVKAAS